MNKQFIEETFKQVKEKDTEECIGKMEQILLEFGQMIKELKVN
jgi:hypothetical protein